ncbi:MAG: transglutaminase domain protein [Caulobacteraceae bacterium]|nr:transglutaminase domain protein [Caulobacteraceae bacterium]
MARLIIEHETSYRYDWPVGFGQHRLLLRPRDSHAMRLVDASLTFSPAGETHWTYDAMGNCVCWFTPRFEADKLTIFSRLVIERFPAPLVNVPLADPQTATPIVYSAEDRAILAPFITPATDDRDGALLKWIRGHIGHPDEPVLDFLLRLNSAIHDELTYSCRFEEGTQAPGQTIALGRGSCRDLAWLMVEALRRLGFAARFVTGYLYDPGASAVRGAGSTHAWCDVFLPGLGWTEFDPTNALAESSDLIPIAFARTPLEASPVSGAIIGNPGRSSLTVEVSVRMEGEIPAAQAA